MPAGFPGAFSGWPQGTFDQKPKNYLDLIGGGGMAALGLPSVLGNLFGGSQIGGSPIDASMIDRFINTSRLTGRDVIGQQTAQANIGAAGSLAQSGLQSSGAATQAGIGNRLNSMRALAQLEATLGRDKMNAFFKLAELELMRDRARAAETAGKRQTGIGLFDVGAGLLSLAGL